MKYSALFLSLACILETTSTSAQDKNNKGAEATYFTLVTAGVVKDKRTGLQWMRCGLGADWNENAKTCVGSVNKYTWQEALESAKKINTAGGYAGSTNWRVPTVRELLSLRYCSNGFVSAKIDLEDGRDLVHKGCNAGSTWFVVAQAVFPHSDESAYWSSSPVAGMSGYAWVVEFGDGTVGADTLRGSGGAGAVRLVR